MAASWLRRLIIPRNGFKLCKESAIPLSGTHGINDIENIINDGSYAPACSGGNRSEFDISKEYYNKVYQYIEFSHKPKIEVDFANAMGIVEFTGFRGRFDVSPLFDDLDGNFPNHEANPLKIETLEELQKLVVGSKSEFGASFDGDTDRCGFVDENGDVVTMDLITAIIAQDILSRGSAMILYDLRSSWVVPEVIEANGGTPVKCRVGHAFIKTQMRECDATFAGKLARHYYFKESFTAESSVLALIMVANVIAKSGKTLSEIVQPLRKYHSSGEINFRINNSAEVLEKIKEKYNDGNQFELDGISTE